MKRLFLLLIITISILTSCNYIEQMSISEGRLLICDNGSYVLISDGSPIVLSSTDEEMFDGLSTGDLIKVYHDGVEESYPARTGADRILLIEKGTIADIDENVAQQLSELGWLEKDDMPLENAERISYQYQYADMSIEILDGWEYEIEEYTEDCHSFGINFRPEGEEGWVKLHCYTSMFAVCGTGLTSENIELAGYDANMGTYDSDGTFSFITFTDASGEYVVQNFAQEEWAKVYEKEIMTMLNTVRLSPEQLSCDSIEEMAKEFVEKEYKEISSYFDCMTGTWKVAFYNNSSDRLDFNFDAQGNLIK